ncbi:MAG: glycosyltransferase family 4 protein [Candidatus Gracilibacteria bacterium]
MKIDYITNLRIPSTKANSIQVMQNCEAFKNAGVDIALSIPFRFGTKKESKINNAWDYYCITNRFKIRHLCSIDLFPLGSCSAVFHLQSFTFHLSVFFLFLFKKTQIIYTREPWIGLFLFYKKNKIIELHNFPIRNFGKKVYKFLLKRFDKIIVISKGLEHEVKDLLPEAKVLVAPDGVKVELFDLDITREEARKKLGIPVEGKIVLYSGSLQKWKGVSVLLNAFEKIDNVKLYIIGSSLDCCDLEIVTDRKDTVFKGHVSYPEIPIYLKAADVLVLPNTGDSSISAKYTSPLKAFEYMASGRPIVVSNLPSLMEIFNNENSYIFEAGNSNDLAAKIQEAFDDPMRVKYPKGDCKKYGWDIRIPKILNFISYENKS